MKITELFLLWNEALWRWVFTKFTIFFLRNGDFCSSETSDAEDETGEDAKSVKTNDETKK